MQDRWNSLTPEVRHGGHCQDQCRGALAPQVQEAKELPENGEHIVDAIRRENPAQKQGITYKSDAFTFFQRMGRRRNCQVRYRLRACRAVTRVQSAKQ